MKIHSLILKPFFILVSVLSAQSSLFAQNSTGITRSNGYANRSIETHAPNRVNSELAVQSDPQKTSPKTEASHIRNDRRSKGSNKKISRNSRKRRSKKENSKFQLSDEYVENIFIIRSAGQEWKLLNELPVSELIDCEEAKIIAENTDEEGHAYITAFRDKKREGRFIFVVKKCDLNFYGLLTRSDLCTELTTLLVNFLNNSTKDAKIVIRCSDNRKICLEFQVEEDSKGFIINNDLIQEYKSTNDNNHLQEKLKDYKTEPIILMFGEVKHYMLCKIELYKLNCILSKNTISGKIERSYFIADLDQGSTQHKILHIDVLKHEKYSNKHGKYIFCILFQYRDKIYERYFCTFHLKYIASVDFERLDCEPYYSVNDIFERNNEQEFETLNNLEISFSDEKTSVSSNQNVSKIEDVKLKGLENNDTENSNITAVSQEHESNNKGDELINKYDQVNETITIDKELIIPEYEEIDSKVQQKLLQPGEEKVFNLTANNKEESESIFDFCSKNRISCIFPALIIVFVFCLFGSIISCVFKKIKLKSNPGHMDSNSVRGYIVMGNLDSSTSCDQTTEGSEKRSLLGSKNSSEEEVNGNVEPLLPYNNSGCAGGNIQKSTRNSTLKNEKDSNSNYNQSYQNSSSQTSSSIVQFSPNNSSTVDLNSSSSKETNKLRKECCQSVSSTSSGSKVNDDIEVTIVQGSCQKSSINTKTNTTREPICKENNVNNQNNQSYQNSSSQPSSSVVQLKSSSAVDLNSLSDKKTKECKAVDKTYSNSKVSKNGNLQASYPELNEVIDMLPRTKVVLAKGKVFDSKAVEELLEKKVC